MFYDYDASTAWIEPLAGEAHPAGYDLCAAHAERLSVPQGWTRADRRPSRALEPAVDRAATPFSDRLAV